MADKRRRKTEPEPSEEYQRFEGAVRHLLTVSKDELDAKLAAEPKRPRGRPRKKREDLEV